MHNSKERARTRLTALAFIAVAGIGIAVTIHFREAHGHGKGHAHADGAAPDAHARDAHAAHGAAPDAAALVPEHGRRWQTDQPLRTGMERIREAARVTEPGKAPLTKETAGTLAASIQDSVNFLIQNCKLDPKADAALHVLITDMMTGAAHLVKDPSSAEGAALITRSLQQYGEYFDHPGWSPPVAGEPRS